MSRRPPPVASPRRRRRRALAATAVAAAFAAAHACTCGAPPVVVGAIEGDGFASVTALNATTVVLKTQDPLDAATVKPASFRVRDFTVVPPAEIEVAAAARGAPDEAAITTGPLRVGTTYTLIVDGLQDETGRPLRGTLNFALGGASTAGEAVAIEIVAADAQAARAWPGGLTALVTVAADGSFSEELVAHPLIDDGARVGVTVAAKIDPSRTVDAADDADPIQDRRAYAVLLVDGAGRLASTLTPFAVDGPATIAVAVAAPPDVVVPPASQLPEPPVDDAPDDGVKLVRIVVDDRASGELQAPAVRTSFDEDGAFDASFPQTLELTLRDDGFWEAIVAVQVDPDRTLDGTSADTFPYIATLVEDDVVYENLSADIVAPDETPETVVLPLGDAAWTPVTFRVDVGGAYLDETGAQKGVFPNEAVFLTGEWLNAVDAFGANCGDGFRGGENLCLKMKPLDGHPGVWTRTLWLPPGRPYGWKVVRCDAEDGCGPLNTLVTSSGRAFATVMKNLATDNVDAFADPDVGIVDPLDLENVVAGGETLDYTGATVHQGAGAGSEPDPAGTPDGQRMFKQEVPDLAVVVQSTPITTRIIHVGTWRDVNLGLSPQEILEQSATVDLGASDYDDGFIGRFPPSREAP